LNSHKHFHSTVKLYKCDFLSEYFFLIRLHELCIK
jgi:hypothetical protein